MIVEMKNQDQQKNVFQRLINEQNFAISPRYNQRYFEVDSFRPAINRISEEIDYNVRPPSFLCTNFLYS